MYFAVGDVVRVKENIVHGGNRKPDGSRGITCNERMLRHKGIITSITKVLGNNRYVIDVPIDSTYGEPWVWDNSLIELYTDKEDAFAHFVQGKINEEQYVSIMEGEGQ